MVRSLQVDRLILGLPALIEFFHLMFDFTNRISGLMMLIKYFDRFNGASCDVQEELVYDSLL